MNATQFLNAMNDVARSYKWEYVDGQIVGTAKNGRLKGERFNPVTALARTRRVTEQPNTTSGTRVASKALNLASTVSEGLLSNSNRGYAQIIRGKVLKALNIV